MHVFTTSCAISRYVGTKTVQALDGTPSFALEGPEQYLLATWDNDRFETNFVELGEVSQVKIGLPV